MRLVDSHAHLQAERFAADAELVVGAARLAGVERLLAPGWDADSSRASIQLAARYDFIDAAVGVHPHVAGSIDDDSWRRLTELAEDARVVAIGETGLDYDRGFAAREAQLLNLRRHLALAIATAKPLILHCRSAPGARDAQDDLVRELTNAGVGGGEWHERFAGRPPAVLHSYSGPRDYAERAIEMGASISFSGLVFRAGEEVSAEVATIVPRDRLLVETDSPYLPPPGAPRRRNEPQYVAITARWLAEQRQEDPIRLGAQLVTNFDHVFRGVPPAR